MGEKVHAVFVGEKINKVRWKPEEFGEANFYVTGSWDDEVNHISLWSYPVTEDDPEKFPCKMHSIEVLGDVSDIQFLNPSLFVASSSKGSVALYNIHVDSPVIASLKLTTEWKKLHSLKNGTSVSCTGIACFEEDIATIGEDGKINLLTAQRKEIVDSIDNAGSGSLSCICFLKYHEVLTGNMRGQMKVWDVKSPLKKPSATFLIGGEQLGATCATPHPTQRHMVLAGGEDGSFTVWDLRHSNQPVTLAAHSNCVSELQFHPDRPEYLFTCSTSGEIWHWNTHTRTSHFNTSLSERHFQESPWFSSTGAKQKFEVFVLMPELHMPINSLSVNRSRVICGCDNEAVYVFKDVTQL